MRLFDHRADGSVRPLIFLLALCFLGAGSSYAQRYFSIEEVSRTVHDKKSTVVDKGIYYTRGGSLNIKWNAGGLTYYSLTSPFGFTDMYYPGTNEKMTLDAQMFNSRDELLYLFAEGGSEDLGMSRSGYVLKSSRKDGSYTVRRYEPARAGGMCAWVELALDESFRPVYCAYFNKKGGLITKTYLSHYTSVQGFSFPMRVTEISYLKDKNDSTVRLDVYRNLRIDEIDDMHVYHIPPGAVSVDIKEGLKALKKQSK